MWICKTDFVQCMLSEWADNKKKVADGKTPKTVPQLCFTDDTAMARSIAASIIQNRTVNVEDIAARFVWCTISSLVLLVLLLQY